MKDNTQASNLSEMCWTVLRVTDEIDTEKKSLQVSAGTAVCSVTDKFGLSMMKMDQSSTSVIGDCFLFCN